MLSREDLDRLDALSRSLTALAEVDNLPPARDSIGNVLRHINEILGESSAAEGSLSKAVDSPADLRMLVSLYLTTIDPAGGLHTIDEDNRDRIVIRWIHLHQEV